MRSYRRGNISLFPPGAGDNGLVSGEILIYYDKSFPAQIIPPHGSAVPYYKIYNLDKKIERLFK